MPDVSDDDLNLVSLGMAIEALREHHASLGPVEGHAAEIAQLIEDVHFNFFQVVGQGSPRDQSDYDRKDADV